MLPATLVYSGVYFVRVRPRLVAAARDLAFERAAARAHLWPTQGPAGPYVDRITLRIPLSFAAITGLSGVFGYSVGFGVMALSGRQWPWGLFIAFSASWLVVAFWSRAFGVTLTPYELVTRSAMVRRYIAWSDIVAITKESRLGSRSVRLRTRTGHSCRLHAPIAQLGVGRRRFDTDFAIIEQWWLTYSPASLLSADR